MEYKPFMVSLEEFFTLDEETRDKLTIEYYSANRRWFHTKLRELNAEYLVIGGTSGNVYRYGSLQNFPEEEELEAISRRTKELPFAWTIEPITEEVVLT